MKGIENMRNKTMSVFRRGLLLFSMAFVLAGCGTKESTETVMETTTVSEATESAVVAVTEEEFFCHTEDQRGEEIQGFYREEDGIWYLFVPSTQSIEDLTIHYTGNVTKVSCGELDTDAAIVTNAFTGSGDKVELTTEAGNVFTVVAMQSNLPSVQIYLKDTTLDTVHLDKNEKFKGNTVVITDPEGEYNLTAEDTVEMKGRGNSTWTLTDKKGYQIKFDEKTSVLGMGKAKKWVLLSNAFDDSMMCTQLVYRMAEKLDMAFVPDFEYIDLWVAGEYRGTYMIGEKVEIGSSRLNLEADTGALFEHDEGFYMEEDYWFLSKVLGRHFTLKEISVEEDDVIASAMDDFEKSVDNLALYLYTTSSEDMDWNELASKIDVDSFAKYYLVNEYVLNRESFVSSFYWYKDGPDDVIHLGPIWDFDTCMGNDGTDFTESYGTNHMLFQYLLAIPEFRERVDELYVQYQSQLLAMTSDIDVLKAELQDSVEMNYLRWNIFGKENPKAEGVYFRDSYEEAVDSVKTWLEGRAENFTIPENVVVNSRVSENTNTMDIFVSDGQSHKDIQFAVWNADKGQDELLWIQAENMDDVWCGQVDLSELKEDGIYYIVAYADGKAKAIANGCGYVEHVEE